MKFFFVHFLTMCLFAFSIFEVVAQEAHEEELYGIVVDRTLTRSGREFYTRFSTIYNSLSSDEKYNIVVAETPIPKLGTKLSILVNHNQIYFTYFGRKLTSGLDANVSESIRAVYDYINQSTLLEDSPDMSVSGY